jgi:HSP20 family protein
MKKIIGSLLIASLLGGALSANSVFANNMYDDEFERMNKYFNSIIESHFSNSALNNLRYPRANIEDKKDKYILEFDLAGVAKENIKLSIDDRNILTIEGEKKSSKKDDSDGYVKQEIFYGNFKRMIQLPENIDQDKLETKYSDGILSITIPKKEVKKPKAKIIQIK